MCFFWFIEDYSSIPEKDFATIQETVQRAGYRPPTESRQWRRIGKDEKIEEILAYHLRHDLAYSYPFISLETSRSLAAALLDHVRYNDDSTYVYHQIRWYSNLFPRRSGNNKEYGGGNMGWNPISDWTFDAAFVGIGSTQTLMVCFFAED